MDLITISELPKADNPEMTKDGYRDQVPDILTKDLHKDYVLEAMGWLPLATGTLFT